MSIASPPADELTPAAGPGFTLAARATTTSEPPRTFEPKIAIHKLNVYYGAFRAVRDVRPGRCAE